MSICRHDSETKERAVNQINPFSSLSSLSKSGMFNVLTTDIEFL